MNRLTHDKRIRIIACLVEGCSIRSTVRMTGVAKNTVVKLLLDLGEACEWYHDQHVRDLQCERVQADEIWSFCYCKDKNVPDSMRDQPGIGSVWTWTAIDKDSKLLVSWYVGDRDAICATRFLSDLASRLSNRVQLTTDGHGVYERAVESAFGWRIDYAQLIKLYGTPKEAESRYSPCECIGTEVRRISGRPISEDICTSHVERANLSMRMGMRRFTRLTNAFSKKLANHRAAVAIYGMHYNFVRIHQTIRCTPAMAAGVTDRLWEIADLVALLEDREANPAQMEAPKVFRQAKRREISN